MTKIYGCDSIVSKNTVEFMCYSTYYYIIDGKVEGGICMENTVQNLLCFETNPDVVAEIVLQGYREIQEGKGIDGEEFFKEFEQRYSK